MKKLNKKGFTLVELLAVIVVLAVIMLLAVNAVIPQMNKARKNAFITEAEGVVNAASAYYQAAALAGGVPTGDTSTYSSSGGCIKVADIKGDYLDKSDSDFTGSVKIEINSTTNVATYTVYLSNGEFLINGVASGSIAESNVTASTSNASTSCGS